MAEETGVSTAPNRVWLSWNVGEKYGNGQALFVGGATFPELADNLEELLGKADATAAIEKWSAYIMDNPPSSAPSTSEAIKNLRAGGLIGNQPQHGEERTCKHGKRQKRTGQKNGKQWTGWFCPLGKDDPENCGPEFAK